MFGSDAALFEASIDAEIADAFDQFKQELATFISGKQRNGYVYGNDVITVYVRKDSTHIVKSVPFKCLDIATITIAHLYQNRGCGMRVINHIHSINPYRMTFIENILNDNLYDRLIGRGWADTESHTDRCVFKLTPLSTPNTPRTVLLP